MAKSNNAAQYQRHYLQLMSRVLNTRASTSPFTLVTDDLNQSAMPLIIDLVRRAVSRDVKVIVVSFEATRFHPAVHSIPAFGDKNGEQILADLRTSIKDTKECLVIIDSLDDLIHNKNVDIGVLFNLVAMEAASTLVGVYHQDILPPLDPQMAYTPQPLDLFKYMATTLINCRSLSQMLAAKAARERSLPEPTQGLLQEAEGVVQSLDANNRQGIVLEVEFRRKSGRPESETYFLRAARQSDYNAPNSRSTIGSLKQEYVTLLAQVPAFASRTDNTSIDNSNEEMESTFNLNLTEKQKQAREGIVLPYFDAQKGEGGEGGRILYDMGEEDDFDEEEDEI